MAVDPADQYRLAFSFGNRQHAWNRCPFGYLNPPSEFTIFPHKALSDAATGSSLIYVGDILMRSRSPEDHSAETERVLSQLLAHFSNSRIASGMMALKGYDTEVEYAQNQKVAAGQSLVERQHCDCTEQSNIKPLLVTTQTLSSPHHHHDEDVCQGLPRVYVHGCSFHHDSQLRAGVGIVWIGQNGDLPSHFQLSPKTNQYAETPAVLTALQQAAKLSITQLVLCSTLNYARHSSTSHLPTGTANGMRNAWNKDVKQSKLFSTCNQLVTDKGMVVDPERVKGHSHVTGPDKAGDDEAEHLAKVGFYTKPN
uniref:RNase H type-1 domain-containing protein n=1 Tax=Salarias fasciatus TaxID=181472 RepID=A0A672I8S6_SALFA